MNQRAPEAPERLLKLGQVADVLGLSLRTVRTLVDTGKLPVVRVSSRCVRVEAGDLRRFVDSRRGR